MSAMQGTAHPPCFANAGAPAARAAERGADEASREIGKERVLGDARIETRFHARAYGPVTAS